MFKYCNNCGFETERNKAGACHICVLQSAKRYRQKLKERPNYPDTYCEKCNAVTPRRKDGWCMECQRKYVQARRDAGLAVDTRKNRQAKMNPEQRAGRDASQKKYLEKNKEKRKAYLKAYVEKNKEKINERSRQWANTNPERQRERVARYHAENPHKAIHRSKVRKCALANRTPAWADENAIKAIYLQAAEFRAAGIDCEVDHIYPLQGGWVSGLHCEANLQIISAHENRSKQNRRTKQHEL